MENGLNSIKEDILKQLIERSKELWVDSREFVESDFRRRIEAFFRSILKEKKGFSLNRHEQEEILDEIISYFLGLGPIEKLLKDPDISEIMVNGPKQVYVERKGNLELTDITFKDEGQLLYFIEKIVSPLGRHLTQLEPYVDARLIDGSRVNIVRAPISTIGPILTIRKFSYNVLSIEDLIRLKTLNTPAAQFLGACIVSRLNILISGGASSGKTTLLNALSSFIPDKERVITIEDTRELRLARQHTVPLETRPPNIEGKGEITIRDLVRNSLHMRPDRIIVGEVRSDEVLDMVQAMNTGHEGSMATLHANSPLEAMGRLEMLSLLGNPNMSSEVAKRQIISAIDLVIDMARFSDGSRKIIRVSEVIKSKEYLLEDILVLSNDAGQEGLKFTGKAPTFHIKIKEKADYFCKEFEEKR